MDGYTVEEAASVLGVPRERVWELLARGILSGSTDLGGGMRVRLKADPPAPPAERSGNGGGHAPADSTPFRELLTEFRSLTERYGQALLALGEARGEVAGLRSRLDTLEARVDLRLPSGSIGPASSWAAPWPVPSERVVQPAPEPRTSRPERETAAGSDAEAADAPAAERDDEAGSHRRRGRSARRATQGFAAALARADDPSPPELPGAADAAAALAALQQERAADGGLDAEDPGGGDVLLPREVPSADAVPVADEEMDVPSAAGSGPDSTAVEPVAKSPGVSVEEPPVADSTEIPVGEHERQAADAAVSRASAGPPDVEAGDWDHEHYSAAIGEPEWISEEEVDEEPAATSTRGPDDLSIGDQPAEVTAELVGAPELDDALAALDALATASIPVAPPVAQEPEREVAFSEPAPPPSRFDVGNGEPESAPTDSQVAPEAASERPEASLDASVPDPAPTVPQWESAPEATRAASEDFDPIGEPPAPAGAAPPAQAAPVSATPGPEPELAERALTSIPEPSEPPAEMAAPFSDADPGTGRSAVRMDVDASPEPAAATWAAPTPATSASWRPAPPTPVIQRSSASRAYRRLRRIFPA